jgi:hypothetical protein
VSTLLENGRDDFGMVQMDCAIATGPAACVDDDQHPLRGFTPDVAVVDAADPGQRHDGRGPRWSYAAMAGASRVGLPVFPCRARDACGLRSS